MTLEYRICRDCENFLPITDFTKNKGSVGGRLSYCNACRKTLNKSNPRKVFVRIYNSQVLHSGTRGHSPPQYTVDELISWADEQPNLIEIWENYQSSNHLKTLAPSVDRLDDSQGYSLSNIRLTTWAENDAKANVDKRAGLLGKATPVSAYNKDGSLYKTFVSAAEAARDTGASPGDIAEVANGIPRLKNGGSYCLKSTKGFIWKWD